MDNYVYGYYKYRLSASMISCILVSIEFFFFGNWRFFFVISPTKYGLHIFQCQLIEIKTHIDLLSAVDEHNFFFRLVFVCCNQTFMWTAQVQMHNKQLIFFLLIVMQATLIQIIAPKSVDRLIIHTHTCSGTPINSNK